MQLSQARQAQETSIPGHSLRLLRFADRLADSLGVLRRPTDADALIEAAQRQTGLSDFGDWSFREPLRILLSACEREADLGTFGRVVLRWDSIRFLANLLHLRAREKIAPVRVEPIEKPIFIAGLPRSGTTFLHSLLAQDPGNAAPLCWQTMYPYPLPGAATPDRPDPRIRKVDRQLRSFAWLAPGLRDLHPITADLPQECTEITAHVFSSLRFDTTYRIPSYREWLDTAGHVEAYRFHRAFLQHLQQQGSPRQWVVKCPDHVFALDAILQIYPDARFVFVHRDPLHVLPSVARLTEILRRPFTRRLDRAAIGRQVADRWALGARLVLEANQAWAATPDRVLNLRYRDLVADPLNAASAVYDHFGMAFTEDGRRAMQHFVQEKPDGGYGRNRYRLQDYGIDPEREGQRYRDYMAAFSVQPETPFHGAAGA